MVKIEVCPFCDEMAMIYIYDNTKDGIEYCKCVKCGKTWETKEQFLKNEERRNENDKSGVFKADTKERTAKGTTTGD